MSADWVTADDGAPIVIDRSALASVMDLGLSARFAESCPCGCGVPSRDGVPLADHPHTDPGDGRTECQTCGKFVHAVTHSCKGVPVTSAAILRATASRPLLHRPPPTRSVDRPGDVR